MGSGRGHQEIVMQRSTTRARPNAEGSSVDHDERDVHQAVGDLVELRSTFRVADAEGDEEEYTVVGSAEADVAHGLISIESPVGRALLGHRRGDALDVRTPGGIRRLTIMDVSVREVALGRVSGERFES
jgi:Transcription elongation factor, GreA/GreB, C-term